MIHEVKKSDKSSKDKICLHSFWRKGIISSFIDTKEMVTEIVEIKRKWSQKNEKNLKKWSLKLLIRKREWVILLTSKKTR